MTLNMENGRSKNSKLKNLILELILVKTIYPACIKNDNGAVAMRKNICGNNNSIN